MNLEICRITADARLQHRVELDLEYVDEMVEKLRENERFDLPAVVILKDADDIHWLADGFSRLEAYKIAKRSVIPAEVHCGDFRAAWKYSLGVNAVHGSRRKTLEIRAILDKCFSDDELSKLTDAQLASLVCVSRGVVTKYRKSLENMSRAADVLKLGGEVKAVKARLHTADDLEKVRNNRDARRALSDLIRALEGLGHFDELRGELSTINLKANLL